MLSLFLRHWPWFLLLVPVALYAVPWVQDLWDEYRRFGGTVWGDVNHFSSGSVWILCRKCDKHVRFAQGLPTIDLRLRHAVFCHGRAQIVAKTLGQLALEKLDEGDYPEEVAFANNWNAYSGSWVAFAPGSPSKKIERRTWRHLVLRERSERTQQLRKWKRVRKELDKIAGNWK